ncbi:hypothetical protein BJX70DRAFT_374392 [Aspergillus crustosus]
MIGFNVSHSAGWYTFSNLGPLTTTFTRNPACTASDHMALWSFNSRLSTVNIRFDSQCTSTLEYNDCRPIETPASTTIPPAITFTTEEEILAYEKAQIRWRYRHYYYSPGLYCPTGWETMGFIARDASDSFTSSGILSSTTTPTRTLKPNDLAYYLDPASVVQERTRSPADHGCLLS